MKNQRRSLSAPPNLNDTSYLENNFCLEKLGSNLLIDEKQSKRECESKKPLQSSDENEEGLSLGRVSFSPMLRLRRKVKNVLSDIERKNEVFEECCQVEPKHMFQELTSGSCFSMSHVRSDCSTEMKSLTERVTYLENSLRNLKVILSPDDTKKRSFVTNLKELFR